MGSAADRRAPRIDIDLPVEVVGPKSSTSHRTANISRGGLFVKTDSPKPTRQLLRLRITFDPRSEPIEVHGMVVHAMEPHEASQRGEEPGMGVEFVAFGGTPRERWEGFLRQLMTNPGLSSAPAPMASQHPFSFAPQSPQAPVTAPTGYPPDQRQRTPSGFLSPQSPQAPVTAPTGYPPEQQRQRSPSGFQQQMPRRDLVTVVFPIPVQSVDQLYEVYERDLVAGVMFICTPKKLELGSRVTMRFIHPVNKDSFDLNGKVQQVHDNPQYPGLSIALRPSTIARRDKFKAFIDAGLPEEDFPFDLIED